MNFNHSFRKTSVLIILLTFYVITLVVYTVRYELVNESSKAMNQSEQTTLGSFWSRQFQSSVARNRLRPMDLSNAMNDVDFRLIKIGSECNHGRSNNLKHDTSRLKSSNYQNSLMLNSISRKRLKFINSNSIGEDVNGDEQHRNTFPEVSSVETYRTWVSYAREVIDNAAMDEPVYMCSFPGFTQEVNSLYFSISQNICSL